MGLKSSDNTLKISKFLLTLCSEAILRTAGVACGFLPAVTVAVAVAATG